MTFWQDLRYALRGLRRAPAFAGVSIATFALGIGATAAIFSAVYAVVLRPFPFPDPDRVIAIGERFPPVQGTELSSVSPGNFDDWRRQGTFFSEIGASAFVSVNVASGDAPDRVLGAAVTAGYFPVFRVSPLIGRTFVAEDDRPGGNQVLILSYRLWTRLFGGDRDVVGQRTQLDGRTYTVIGVMPRAFDSLGRPEEFWVPAAFTPAELLSHDNHNMEVVARLADGASIETAAAELPVIFNRVKRQTTDNQVREGIVAPYATELIGDSRERLLILFGAVALVMLIACGNVAHLLLARGRVRAHEVALRTALGASQRRILQQFLTESLALALLGGALGVALAYVLVPALVALSPAGVPRLEQATVNGPVLLFALLATALSAMATGIVPALGRARRDTAQEINGASGRVARGHDALRGVLVVAEVALAIVLLTGAGLLVRSAIYLQSVNPGFDGRGVLTARVSLPTTGYEDRVRVEQTFLAIVTRLAQTGTIDVAAVGSSVPMAPGATNNGLVPEGKVFDPNDFVLGRLGIVSDQYFAAFRIPLLEGRAFSADDRSGSPLVMVLSETAARRLFPGESAVGKRVACCEQAPDGGARLKLVIGVVGDVRADGPREETRPDFYVPIPQAPPDAWDWLQRTMTVVVRGTGVDTGALGATLRETVRAVDSALPLYDIATMDQRLQTALATDRFNTTLMMLLGAVGLFLSAIGIYGVISGFVAQRRREIAIRIALGAQSHEVVTLVLKQGMQPVWVGVGLGLLGALAASRTLSASVYGITTRDPVTLIAVVALLLAVALAANLLPARTAARLDPSALLAG